ncbi:hypothetical protein CMQ_6841 [Grosmannia clavigera kw1407]|uniref:Uncharacterized protein n=1 Tax=Grosmannia clavigera (strain kw1407 / UAMH 11150) TaxID=655863 RepID=F0X707_GROCL|nr:uncharacterized protein CMQ_6841 [Grosmannia clavigera kw1407]EFX06520.1 hypothetical protein CMQ_6841 [Grosmannia clavigera kw1407]
MTDDSDTEASFDRRDSSPISMQPAFCNAALVRLMADKDGETYQFADLLELVVWHAESEKDHLRGKREKEEAVGWAE